MDKRDHGNRFLIGVTDISNENSGTLENKMQTVEKTASLEQLKLGNKVTSGIQTDAGVGQTPNRFDS